MAIASAAAKLRARSFTIDGEASSLASMASPCSIALHRRRRATDAMLYAFDLLEPQWQDLRPCARDRKAKLRSCWRSAAGIVSTEHTDQDGATVFRARLPGSASRGMCSKRLTAPYRSGVA